MASTSTYVSKAIVIIVANVVDVAMTTSLATLVNASALLASSWMLMEVAKPVQQEPIRTKWVKCLATLVLLGPSHRQALPVAKLVQPERLLPTTSAKPVLWAVFRKQEQHLVRLVLLELMLPTTNARPVRQALFRKQALEAVSLVLQEPTRGKQVNRLATVVQPVP